MLDIYKASAGSGKTFALTLAYFRIIFESPGEYRNILAVTFTNKATEEMKSRIITELHRLAEGEATDYGRILKQELGLDDAQLKNKASMLRMMLLHDYGRMAVTTIDRFFQRIIKSFTRELGIFPGYNVELDSEFVLLKAVDKMVQQVHENPALKQWISELMSSNVDEGRSWRVKDRIADLGGEIFRENYMLFDEQVIRKFSDKEFLRSYKDFLSAIRENYEHRQAELAGEAMAAIRDAGLDYTDFKGGKSSCASYFHKLAEGVFGEPTATVLKGATGGIEAWATKDSPNKAAIESLLPCLQRTLQEMLGVYERDYRRYLSAEHLAGNLYQLGILNDLYREVRGYCEEKGLMLLSDTTRILNQLIAGNDASFLFEKCGNYYKHLMIDEFQDTSAMQWKNFQPLVTNSLSEGSRAMIVGDVKQSIYRWRNGDWRLLAYGVEDDFRHFGVNNVCLKDNWRSAREVVEFNNTFFEAASDLLARLYAESAGEEDKRVEVIREAYREVSQCPKKEKTGYVDIAFGPEKKEEESDSLIMEDVTGVVTDIVSRGGRLKEVVILVRSGKEGAFVADYLMEYNKTAECPIPFISNDSLYVNSSPYVQFIVAVLKYLTEPYDQVNRATILYFYHIFVKDEANPALHRIFKAVSGEDLLRSLSAGFEQETTKILSYSLFETIETIIGQFALREKREEIPYLIAFQDIVHEYESNNSNSITLFLEWWEKEQGKRVLATSEEVDAVRILTIHKSKGLEFEYVILPFCSWELDSVRPVRKIWCEPQEPGFNELAYAPLNYSSKLTNTIFREDYLNEHLKAYIDNLNLLYVALTRAKTELYVRPYSPKKNKSGELSMSDMGAFIYRVLEEWSGRNMEENRLVVGKKQSRNDRDAEKKEAFVLEHYPVWQPGERISVKYRFQDYTDPDSSGRSAIDEGKLLHEIFKSVRSAGDVGQAVQKACLAGLIRQSEKAEYCAKVTGFLEAPEVAAWFSPDCEVINERDILFPGGTKARPDRVVVADGIVRVIDYKFGQSEEGKYVKQVGFYCNTLRKMGYQAVEGYIWYVKLDKIVRV